MTWYAHSLFMPATERAVDLLGNIPSLRTHLYVVRDLGEFPWHTPVVTHDLGPNGLAIVRPIGPTNEDGSDEYGWFDEPVLPWHSLLPIAPDASPVIAHVEDGFAPPPTLLQFLGELAERALEPVVYYSCCTWGGDIEFEASWAFTPRQITYVTRVPPDDPPGVRTITPEGRCTVTPGDALRKGLSHLGLELPSWFFALHTRSFPWERYRVG